MNALLTTVAVVVLNLLIFIPPSLGQSQNKTVSTVELISENSTHNDNVLGQNEISPDEESIGDMFRKASYEIVELSPLAWAMILVPLVTTFIFCVLIVFLCCRKAKAPSQCRYEGKNFVDLSAKEVASPKLAQMPTHVVVKAPAGQPAPIPLTGLVNQPNGHGLKLMHKPHYYQPGMNYNHN